MLSLGVLSFAAPWALVALAAMPALWWLLRVSPPSPRRVVFPPLRLLAGLSSREESVVRTPWWLLALRLALVVSLILGAARPLLNAGELAGSGPVYLLVDDGWASASSWTERQTSLVHIIDQAEWQGRAVVLLTTAPRPEEHVADWAIQLPPAKAREIVQAFRPKPWATDRAAAIDSLLRSAEANPRPPGLVVWISDGIDQPEGADKLAVLLEKLERLGRVTLVVPRATDTQLLLKPEDPNPNGLGLTVVRTSAAGETNIALRLFGDDGTPLARQTARFARGERHARVVLDLPAELSPRLARAEVEGHDTAGTVLLLDERWQRRAIGLLDDRSDEQPLLGADYYLERALQPFAEVRHGDAAGLLARPLAVLVLTDVGTPDPVSVEAIRRWVEKGGVLLRFGGPRLAREASRDDPLLPVPLRAGDRTIGGALSWTGAGKLAPFEPSSPFHGLRVPGDLQFQRQVFAEPSLDVAERTWAETRRRDAFGHRRTAGRRLGCPRPYGRQSGLVKSAALRLVR